MRKLGVLAALAVALSGCSGGGAGAESVVYVTVAAPSATPPVYQLQATLTLGALLEVERFPGSIGTAPVTFDPFATFVLTLPRARIGKLDISVDALGVNHAPVARGENVVEVVPGGRADVTVALTVLGAVDAGAVDALGYGPLDTAAGWVPDAPIGVGGSGGSSTELKLDAGMAGAPGFGGSGGISGSTGRGGAVGAGGMGTGGRLPGLDGSVGPRDAGCHPATVSPQRMATSVLLLLDRSGSMNMSIAESCFCDPGLAGRSPVCPDTANCTTRWSALTSALGNTLSTTTDISWGLKLFTSAGTGCTVASSIDVAISPTSAGPIATRISTTSPGGSRPTAQAVTSAATYLKTISTPSNKVILLATDGEPNCGSGGASVSNVPATVEAITAARAAGFPVYVLGIGLSVANLDSFAQAGGTGKYYPAMSTAAVGSALTSIVTKLTTCTVVSPTPPDPNNVAVYLDKELVPRDEANGWTFGATNQFLVFNGNACARLATAQASNIEIVLGCSGYAPTGGAGGTIGYGGTGGGGGGGMGGNSTTTSPLNDYTWVVLHDTEQKACTTNGPGADIDAVALWDLATNTALGWGKAGTATFTPNPLGNTCENGECTGGDCKYAEIGMTFVGTTQVAWTEGSRDAIVSGVTDDYGYLSLNGGTLQIQIGDAFSTGPAQVLRSGDVVRVFELDKSYISSGDAPATCSCRGERYTVALQSAAGAAVLLRPSQLAAENATTCPTLTTTSTEGCGTTTFVVP